MTAPGEQEDTANKEDNRPMPRRDYWQSARDRFWKSTRNWIVGIPPKFRTSGGSALDALDFVSPLLTAVATVAIVWVAYWQWDVLAKTEQTNREINRAFVKGQSLNMSQDQFYWHFTTTIENTGSTQAKNLEVFIDHAFALNENNDRPSPGRQRPLFTPIDPEEVFEQSKYAFPAFSRIPLGPKSTTVVGGYDVPIKHIDDMAANRSDGYVYGVLWYDDVFIRSERHKSKFCFVVQPVKSNYSGTRVSYGLCSYWNCTDDECDEHKKQYEIARKKLNPTPSPN